MSNKINDLDDHLMNTRILIVILEKTIIVAHKCKKMFLGPLTLSFVKEMGPSPSPICTTLDSLRPKMIVLFLIKIIPKWLFCFCPDKNLWLKVKYFHAKPSISRSLSTPQLLGALWRSCSFYHEESYLQLFGQWSAALGLAKVRNTNKHFGMEGVIDLYCQVWPPTTKCCKKVM